MGTWGSTWVAFLTLQWGKNWNLFLVLYNHHSSSIVLFLMVFLCTFFTSLVFGCRNKKETTSYMEISESLGVDNPAEILFLTDVYQEATAAKSAGLLAIFFAKRTVDLSLSCRLHKLIGVFVLCGWCDGYFRFGGYDFCPARKWTAAGESWIQDDQVFCWNIRRMLL